MMHLACIFSTYIYKKFFFLYHGSIRCHENTEQSQYLNNYFNQFCNLKTPAAPVSWDAVNPIIKGIIESEIKLNNIVWMVRQKLPGVLF